MRGVLTTLADAWQPPGPCPTHSCLQGKLQTPLIDMRLPLHTVHLSPVALHCSRGAGWGRHAEQVPWRCCVLKSRQQPGLPSDSAGVKALTM